MNTTPPDAITTSTAAASIADALAEPELTHRLRRSTPHWRQSLCGALGVALMHVERARTGHGSWDRAHTWLRYAAAGPVDAGVACHLYFGAPALATVLQHAATCGPVPSPRRAGYERALTVLDHTLHAVTARRIDAAHRRIDHGLPPALAEFDAVRGLAGLGRYWLRRTPHSPTTAAVLGYLVRLTGPRHERRPGWWSHLGPDGRPDTAFPDGHANLGMAHGIAGPLSLLALAERAHVTVPGQPDAIRRILGWLDDHRHDENGTSWWPYWVTGTDATHQGRPSWCYGALGLARAHQLAGVALHDHDRAHHAEHVLLANLTDPELLTRLQHPGLCHGAAGALLIARRAAHDSPRDNLHRALPALIEQVATDTTTHQCHRDLHAGDPASDTTTSLLDGAPGLALALDDHDPLATHGWDTCLLTS